MPTSTTPPTDQTWHLDPGLLRPLIDRFTGHLASLGHTPFTVCGYGDAARHFAVWLLRSGLAAPDIDGDTCAGFASHQCRCPGVRRSDRVSAKWDWD